MLCFVAIIFPTLCKKMDEVGSALIQDGHIDAPWKVSRY